MDLAGTRPRAVGVLAAPVSDDDGGQERQVEPLRRPRPRLAGDQGELAPAGGIEGGDAVLVLVDEPGVRDLRSGSGGGLEVELRIAPPLLLAGGRVRHDRGRCVALVGLDALGVELEVLELQGPDECLAHGHAFGAGVAQLGEAARDRVGLAGRAEARSRLATLVGAGDDLLADGRPFERVGVQQRLVGVAVDRVASFHAGLKASWMDVLEPSPLLGGWRCTASPPQRRGAGGSALDSKAAVERGESVRESDQTAVPCRASARGERDRPGESPDRPAEAERLTLTPTPLS
jgi:hypothetical protein